MAPAVYGLILQSHKTPFFFRTRVALTLMSEASHSQTGRLGSWLYLFRDAADFSLCGGRFRHECSHSRLTSLWSILFLPRSAVRSAERWAEMRMLEMAFCRHGGRGFIGNS